MSWFIAPLSAAVVGLLLAMGAVVLLVNSQSAVPAPVDAPYIVYGSK